MAVNGSLPRDPDDFFAVVTTLLAEGKSDEAYEYKTRCYPFVMGAMSPDDLRRLENIEATLFLTGHVPNTREKSRLPDLPLDPSLNDE